MPQKKSLAERLQEIRPNPLTPTLSDYAPGEHDPKAAAREAVALENQAKKGTARPVPLVAGVSTVPRRRDPLAIRLLRIPGKPTDAANAFARRMVDEGKYGSGPGEALAESVRAGLRALTDLNRDVAPTAIRAGFGVEKGKSSRLAYNAATAADYLFSALTDPAGLVTGPAGKLLAKIPAVKAGGQVVRAGVTAAKGKVGQAARATEKAVLGDATSASSRALASTLGVGPAARMIRETRGAYEPGVGLRFKQAEEIVAAMRAWTLARRRADPAFSRAVEQYQGKHPASVDPLTDAVRMYVRFHRHKGKTSSSTTLTPSSLPAIDPNDLHQLQVMTSHYGIPLSVVQGFGDRIIKHGEETLSALRATGANPFEQARGLQSKRPLTGSAKFPTQAWTGVHNQAKARSEDRLRSIWFGRYLEDLLPHSELAGEALHTLAPRGARASRGKHGEIREGIQAVRRAGIRDLVAQLEGAHQTGLGGAGQVAPGTSSGLSAGGYLKRWSPGQDVPEGWVVVTAKRLPLPQAGAAVPMAKEMEFLKDRMMPRDLYNYLAGEMGHFIPTVTKAGRSLGVEGPILQSRNRILNFWTRAIGTRKRTWLTNPATFITNTIGNHLLAEIALRRNDIPIADFERNLLSAGKEALAFERTAQMSPDIQSLSARTRAFMETIAEGAGVRPGSTGRAAAGAAGVRREVPGIGGVIVPEPDFSQVKGAGLAGVKGRLAEQAKTAGTELERLGAALGSAHGFSERTYKLALYKTLLPKLGADKAAEVVQRTLFDYSDRPALLEAADRYGLVIFNAFPMFATKALFETIATRPDLVAKYPRLARLSRVEMGAQGAEENLAEEKRTAHLTATGEETFLDPSRYFPLAGPIDFFSRPGSGWTGDQLPRTLAGSTAIGPEIEQAFNMRLLGGSESPWRIVPPGGPPPLSPGPLPDFLEGDEGDLRAREYLNAILPGLVRGTGRIMAAREGVSTGTGRTSEAQSQAEAFLQGILGLRTVKGEAFPARDERTLPLQAHRNAQYMSVRESVRNVPPAANPFTAQASEIRSLDDLDRKLTALDKWITGVLPSSTRGDGQLTEAGRRLLVRAALWEDALLQASARFTGP